MTVPRMTAEYGIGPAFGSYGARLPGGHEGALAPMKGPLMRNTDATTGDRMVAKMTNAGPDLCGPGQTVCWGTSGTSHEYDYICCDANEGCVRGTDGTPDCQVTGPVPEFSNIHLPASYRGLLA